MNTALTSLPRGAAPSRPASIGAGSWLSRAAGAVRNAFERAGRARAQRHLLQFADACEALQPELAKELRAASRQGPMG